MRIHTFAALAGALICGPILAQAPPTIDTALDKVAEAKKQRAAFEADVIAKRTALEKSEADAATEFRTRFKELNEKIQQLGLLDPPKPVPPPTPPVPPAPTDPLKAKLKAAFDADPVQLDVRKGQALDLAALYKQAAVLAADASVLSAGDLLNRVRDAARSLVGADSLKAVRTVASAELGAILPTDAPLTAEQRAAVAALFAKLATALEEIAK